MPYQTRASVILERWRETRRHYDDASDPGVRTAYHVELHKLKEEHNLLRLEHAAARLPR